MLSPLGLVFPKALLNRCATNQDYTHQLMAFAHPSQEFSLAKLELLFNAKEINQYVITTFIYQLNAACFINFTQCLG